MTVLDASAALDLLLIPQVAAMLGERLFDAGETLHAPHLLDLEVAQVLRRCCLSGELGPERASQALQDFLALPITRYPHDIFLSRIWELRHNLTAYDAAYVALAEALSSPLLTRDKALASSAGHRAVIELV